MDRSATAQGVVEAIRTPAAGATRKDALRNQQLVVTAALEIFAERGGMGTIEQIAERAGVARATVYRNFPSRDALLVAVATSQFQQIHTIALLAQEASAGSGTGLIDFVLRAFEYNQANRLYLELFDARPTPQMRGVHSASRTTIAELTDESRRAGVVRADVTDEDLALLIAALSTRLAADRSTTHDDWQRAARLVLLALGVPTRMLPPAPATQDGRAGDSRW